MQFILIILGIYLLLGFIYAVYITFWGGGRWYMFPFNVLGGPVVFLIIVIRTLRGDRFNY